MNTGNREIEVRFLEVDVPKLTVKLAAAGAEDGGEELLREIIFYGNDVTAEARKFIRLRQERAGTFMTFKHHQEFSATGTREVEVKVDDLARARVLLEALGFAAFREQEKRRHAFTLGTVHVDIVTWSKLPPLVELEGPNEDGLRAAARELGLDWAHVELRDNRAVIEEQYGIPVSKLRYFTFSRVE